MFFGCDAGLFKSEYCSCSKSQKNPVSTDSSSSSVSITPAVSSVSLVVSFPSLPSVSVDVAICYYVHSVPILFVSAR